MASRFQESPVREIVANPSHHIVPEDDVPLERLPAEVQVAVAEPNVFRCRAGFVERERRRLAGVQNGHGVGLDLDAAGRKLRIFASRRTPKHRSLHEDHELGADLPRPLHRLRVQLLGPEDDLRETVAIAQIQEENTSVVADAVGPAHQADVRAGLLGAQVAAAVSPPALEERLDGGHREPPPAARRARSQVRSVSRSGCFISSFPRTMSRTANPSASRGTKTTCLAPTREATFI